MIKKLHEMGIKSDWAYGMAFASMGLTYVSYFTSRAKKSHDKSQSDRWGLFISTWAPTMFAFGTALRLEEMD
jgi:bacteriorhodopsin